MGNITENKLNMVISAVDLTAINANITAISAKLPAGSLTDDQRMNLKAINVDNNIFVEDTLTELTVNGQGLFLLLSMLTISRTTSRFSTPHF
ncbi:hypothetical protein [uncultured Flavobacterium sp.]|uniref:hypothetical protein n=1 Tax=uncultured Flavobacterium sp. TaxID=165435 RepID=UPI0025F4CCB5|nr:hypothetical protein [uncultured Flavobacterium sp.]